jgi:hypothetical protein
MAVVVFDFDDTLLDTSALKEHRDNYRWSEAVRDGAQLEFDPELVQAVNELRAAGHTLVIASTSPYENYVRHFIERSGMQFDRAIGHWEARELPSAGITGRAETKARALLEYGRQYPGKAVVLVGDDGSDSYGARIAGVAFGHACWGGECKFADEHIDTPANLPAAVGRLEQLHKEPQAPRALDTFGAGTYTYAVLRVRGIATYFLDTYHKQPCDERFVPSNDAIHALKAGNAEWIERFSTALATIAPHLRDDRGLRVDAVIPMMGSKDITGRRESPVARLAGAVAHALGVPLRLDALAQTQRDSLHTIREANFEQRYNVVYPNLRVQNVRDARFLLVDDLVSSGATSNAYRDRLAEGGAQFVAVLAVMKYMQERELLNPGLYG